MPRPKRTKVASTAPTRVAKPTEETTAVSKQSRPGRKAAQPDGANDRTNARTSSQDMDVVEPEQDAPKKRGRPRKGAKKVVPDDAHTKALEGLRKKMEAAKATPAPKSAAKSASTEAKPMSATERLAAQRAERRKTGSSSRDSTPANPVSAVRSAERPRTPTEEDSDDIYGISPAGKAALRNSQAAQIAAKRLSTQVPAPQSTLKVQGTPAVETSILALQNFKRRPRQPSILRMVQQRESAIHSDFDDFEPDDESTPLNFGKLQAEVDSSGVDLGSDSRSPDQPRTSSSRKRKRSTPEPESEVQVLRSSPPLADNSHVRRSPDVHSDSDHSLPEAEHIRETQDEPEDRLPEAEPSSTMAPPKSSSSLYGDDDQRPETPRPAKRRQSITSHKSPASTRKQQSRKPAKEAVLSTAALQALLPQRRRKARGQKKDTFDIPSSDDIIDTTMLDSDEDELGARRPAPKQKKRGALSRLAKSPASAKKTAAKRTYGRRSSDKENRASDSENESDDGDTTVEEVRPKSRGKGKGKAADEVVSKSKELEAAAKKFQEVDQWEMEFESVTIEDSASSPWR